MRALPLLCLLALPLPALADVPEAVAGIGAAYDHFAETTGALALATEGGCAPDRLRPAYQAAFDGWMGVSHIRIGPVEDGGRAMAIAFWPDPKGSGRRAQAALLQGDPALLAPDRFAEQSVAARGLFGLERLLYPATAPETDPCPLIRATARDLARMADEIAAEWPAFGALLVDAGAPGNGRFLTVDEAKQALLTQLVTALEYDADQRLGRPLGSADRPQPDRAEALAAGRPLRNIATSLAALREMVRALHPQSPATLSALNRALDQAAALEDPLFAGVADPAGRLKVEILQQAIRAAREAALAELAPALGVGVGFNALDGD